MLTSDGYIGVGRQISQGTAVTPSFFIPALSEGFSTERSLTAYTDDLAQLKEQWNDGHREAFSFDFYARPKIAAYFLGYLLGADTIAGAGDPYTHTLAYENGSRPWLTLDRKLTTGQVQRLYDCKVNSVTLSGESGKPVKMAVQGRALNCILRTTTGTPSYDTNGPFMFYHGHNAYVWLTTTAPEVKSFSVQLSIDEGAGLQDDTINLADLPDYSFSANVTAGYMMPNINRWKRINYNNTTAPSETVYSGRFGLTLQYTLTSTRFMSLNIPKCYWVQHGGMNISGDSAMMEETVTGVAVKQDTTDFVSVVCKNAISTTIVL